jgi:hypothetical protein
LSANPLPFYPVTPDGDAYDEEACRERHWEQENKPIPLHHPRDVTCRTVVPASRTKIRSITIRLITGSRDTSTVIQIASKRKMELPSRGRQRWSILKTLTESPGHAIPNPVSIDW